MSLKRYTVGILVGIGIGLCVWAPYYWYIREIGETDLNYVIKRQQKNPQALFMSGFNQEFYPYKELLYKAAPHTVIIIGSSRAMLVSKNLMQTDFVNLGGSINAISQLERMSQVIINDKNPPKIILMFTDIWWFNNDYVHKFENYKPNYSPLVPTFASISTLTSKMNTWERIKASLESKNKIGFDAMFNNKGFDRYGTLIPLLSTGHGDHPDANFKDVLGRIATSSNRFEKQDEVQDDIVNRFASVIKEFQSRGITVVTILPPFPQLVIKEMKKGGYDYVIDFKNKLSARGVAVYDYTDSSSIPGATDCEFWDGLHGGEVVYARMLNEIIRQRPDLKPYFNVKNIEHYIKDYAGWVAPATKDYFPSFEKEGDFLNLGCKR